MKVAFTVLCSKKLRAIPAKSMCVSEINKVVASMTLQSYVTSYAFFARNDGNWRGHVIANYTAQIKTKTMRVQNQDFQMSRQSLLLTIVWNYT